MSPRARPRPDRCFHENRHFQRQRHQQPTELATRMVGERRAGHRVPTGTQGDRLCAALRQAGYGAIWQGQRSWNGVAILAKGAARWKFDADFWQRGRRPKPLSDDPGRKTRCCSPRAVKRISDFWRRVGWMPCGSNIPKSRCLPSGIIFVTIGRPIRGCESIICC